MKSIVKECAPNLLAVQDTMNVLSGKWKIPILVSIMAHQKLCFKDMMSEVEGISAKVLSKELREMEDQKLISRHVMNKGRITVEYSITPYGKTLEDVILILLHWGLQHRKEITGKNNLLIPIADYISDIKNNLPCKGSHLARN